MVEVPVTSFVMANLSPSLQFSSLPFHKALPKTCLISSYNFVRPRHRHFHTIFASSSLKRTGTVRKVMNKADLCKNIREFVSSFGFPEGHVPSMKELSQHGRQDLANIVRRRGYKMIRDLLATSAQTDKNEFDTQESFTFKQCEKVEDITDDIVKDVESESSVVRDSTTDILLQNESHGMGDVENVGLNSEISGLENNLLLDGNEVSVVSSYSEEEKYALQFEHDKVGDVAKEYLRNEAGDQEDFSRDVSDLLSVKDEDGIIPEDSFLESNSNNEVGATNKDISSSCEYEEPAYIVRDLFSMQTQNNEVGAVANITSLKNEDDIGICEGGAFLQSENEFNVEAFSSCHQKFENDVTPNSRKDDVVGDVSKDIFFHSESVPQDICLDSGNPLDEESSGSKIISKSPNDTWLKDNARKLFQDGESKEKSDYMEARLEAASCDVESSSEQQKSGDNEAGFEHLRFMLRKKELELTRLKKLIEREQLALSTLQSETEIKIKEAQQVILEKDAELQAAEETLCDLQEVEIQFHVDGGEGGVELAGSFNGWHHRVKMDQCPPETSKLRSGLWTTVLWLYPGIYEIKFIVDGNWRLDPHRQVLTRGHIQNNILQVKKR